jgi:hypothetical protein
LAKEKEGNPLPHVQRAAHAKRRRFDSCPIPLLFAQVRSGSEIKNFIALLGVVVILVLCVALANASDANRLS